MAHIERRVSQRREGDGRSRQTARYKVRYRDSAGREHSETKTRRVDAERRRSEIESEMAVGSWRDPRLGDVLLSAWLEDWLPTRHDLRATTKARLETTMTHQVLPRFGGTALRKITNSEVRRWVADLLASGLSAATTPKAVFALRQTLEAAIADGRLLHNAAAAVPLPAERQKPPRYLSQPEVKRLLIEIPVRDQALILVGAYAGLRWGEAAGLRRRDIDPLRSRIRVSGTAVQLYGQITLDCEPKTPRSKRTIPMARSIMRRIEHHLDETSGPHRRASPSQHPAEARCTGRGPDGP